MTKDETDITNAWKSFILNKVAIIEFSCICIFLFILYPDISCCQHLIFSHWQ